MWTWHNIVRECEDVLGVKDHAETPYMCNLTNLIRDLKFKLGVASQPITQSDRANRPLVSSSVINLWRNTMEIADVINQKQIECITKRGYEPKFAYLGKIEMESLLSWAKDWFGHEEKYKADSGIEFLGLRCFEVNTENHLNVA